MTPKKMFDCEECMDGPDFLITWNDSDTVTYYITKSTQHNKFAPSIFSCTRLILANSLQMYGTGISVFVNKVEIESSFRAVEPEKFISQSDVNSVGT